VTLPMDMFRINKSNRSRNYRPRQIC